MNLPSSEFEKDSYWRFLQAGHSASIAAGLFLGFGLGWLFLASIVVTVWWMWGHAVAIYLFRNAKKIVLMFLLEFFAVLVAIASVVKLRQIYGGEIPIYVYMPVISLPAAAALVQLYFAKKLADRIGF